MSTPSETVSAASTTATGELPGLPQRRKIVLVMDLVESVRLMAANELAVVEHWRGFVRHVRMAVLPAHGGRLVKSLGDGLLAEFDGAVDAAAAALKLHAYFDSVNARLPPEQRLHLRAGLNATQVYVDDIDIYGAGVNLAARVAGLAGPGETLVTAEARDELTDGLEVQLQDLGECFVKHIAQPIRAYRLGAAGEEHAFAPESMAASLQPATAVIPFQPIGADIPDADALGDALADDIISALSQATNLVVISRLSAAPFREAPATLAQIRSLLGAAYVITGTFTVKAGQMQIRAQLCETRNAQVLWSDSLHASVADIFNGEDGAVPAIAANAGRLILQKELERTRTLPLTNLESYTLYVGSVTLLHRFSHGDFVRSRELLEHLTQRHPKRAAPYAMLAKWHLMRILQAWSPQPRTDRQLAIDMARRALRCDGQDPFALATDGFLAAHFSDDLAFASERCTQALELNPQEAQVWRMLATVHSYLGEGGKAESAALRALSLTPLDPTRFIYELVVGASKLACGKFDEALHWADRSLRGNVMHVPTHRLRVIALALAGRSQEARDAAAGLVCMAPGFSVAAYSRSYPGRDQPHAREYIRALRSAGLPD